MENTFGYLYVDAKNIVYLGEALVSPARLEKDWLLNMRTFLNQSHLASIKKGRV